MLEFIIVSLCSALFGAYVFYRETKRIKRVKTFQLINLFGYMYGVTYGFLPACVFLLYIFQGVNISHAHYGIDYSYKGLSDIMIWLIFAVIGYAVLSFSYRTSFTLRHKMIKPMRDYLPLSVEGKKRMFGKMQVCIFLCFAISCVSLYLWLRAYGGFWGLILIADQVRDGVSDVQNSMAFFMRPAKMIMLVFFMSIMLIKNRYNSGINIFFLVVSFFLSILMLLALDGRLGMVSFLAITVLQIYNFFEIGEFDWKKLGGILLFCVVAVIILTNMNVVTLYLRTGNWLTEKNTAAVEGFLREFSYIFVGAQNAVSMWRSGEIPYLIGQDIMAGLFAWIPSSLRPDWIINVWDYNTALCVIGSQRTGQLPCDFITTSLYDLGLAGPIVLGFFWGQIIRMLDYNHRKVQNPAFDVLYYAVSMRIFRLVNYCLLYDFVLGSFDIFLTFVIWKFCEKIKFRLH